jgi:hypothetical protein
MKRKRVNQSDSLIKERNQEIFNELLVLTKDGTLDNHEKRAEFMYDQLENESTQNEFRFHPSVYGLLNDWATKGWVAGFEKEYEGELSGDRALTLYRNLCNHLEQKKHS